MISNRNQTDQEPITTPFTILIDSREQHPFSFTGLAADANKGYRPLKVMTQWLCLGTGRGDYSIDGFQDQIAIERKSLDDFHGTVLGWSQRRDNFERELEWLNSIEFAAVVVEASFGAVLANAPEWGRKTANENRKSLFRSVLAWQQKYPLVHWAFMDSRRLAEIYVFRSLEKFWEHKQREKRRAARAAREAERSMQELF